MTNQETVKASERGQLALAALADTDAEVEACADAVLDDLNDRFDGRDHNDQTGWR